MPFIFFSEWNEKLFLESCFLEKQYPKPLFFYFQVAYLFTFLAQQIAKEENCLNVSRELFKKVLDVLTDTTEKSHHEERQQALLDMLSAGALDYLEDEVKLKAQNVGFYRSVK